MNYSRLRSVVLVVLAGMALTAIPAFAQGPNPYGQPQVIVRTQPAYYVWADQAGWHVRWSTPVPITLSGIITTNGRFSTVCPTARALPSGLSFATPRRAIFTIPAGPGIGGFDFRTTGGQVTFNLGLGSNSIQGQIPAWLVYIGQSLFPSLRQFTLSANPIFGGVEQAGCREPHISDVERPNH